MDGTTQAAISQAGLACAVIDRAGALIHMVMPMERDIYLYQAHPSSFGLTKAVFRM